MSTSDRLSDAFAQLTRYSGAPCTEVIEVLEKLTDINDDICNGRDPSIIRKQIDAAKALLDRLVDV